MEKSIKRVAIGVVSVVLIIMASVTLYWQVSAQSMDTNGQALTQKDPGQDPYAQGNAPIAGGLNEDPGPGTYITPSAMPRITTVAYVAPAPPQ